MSNNNYQWRRQVVLGLLLMLFGLVLLLDQLDMFDLSRLWHYWPLLLVVVGLNKMIGSPTARDFTSGVWMTFIGLWLFVVFEGMFGLTFYNSWPIFIIVSGVTIMLQPVVARRLKDRESTNEKQ